MSAAAQFGQPRQLHRQIKEAAVHLDSSHSHSLAGQSPVPLPASTHTQCTHVPEHHHCSLCARSPKGKYCPGGAYSITKAGVILAPLSYDCPLNMTTVGRRSVTIRACGESYVCCCAQRRHSSRMLTTLIQPATAADNACARASTHAHAFRPVPAAASDGSSTGGMSTESLNLACVIPPALLVTALCLQSRILVSHTASAPTAPSPQLRCAQPTPTVPV